MSATGEDELICDFAETYHILDWRGLPINLAATLAAGLPEDSRIKMKIRGDQATIDQILLARICDLLSEWVWAFSKNAKRPESIVKILTASPKQPEQKKHRVFKDGDSFMKELSRFVGGKNNG